MRTIVVRSDPTEQGRARITHLHHLGYGHGWGGVQTALSQKEARELIRQLEMRLALKAPLEEA